jgi:UDP-glucuronate decarboxylase
MAGVEEHPLLISRAASVSLPESVAHRLVDGRQRVVVLGATGWLGMVALDLFESALGPTFTEQVSAWASRERVVELRSGNKVVARALRDARPGDVEGAVVLHFAFLTRDRVTEMGTDEFLRANLAITQRVLSLLEAGAPSGFVYTSSGAVYDANGGFAEDVLDNPYGVAKRLDELALAEACSNADVSCVIPRVFSVSGPNMTKPELYALGDLILQASRGESLRIRATRPVYRSYVAVGDLVSVCTAAALEGERDLVFDSGGDVVEVGDLAELVRVNAGRPDMPIERTWDPAAEADRYVADNVVIMELARRFGVAMQSLPDQVAETAADLLRATSNP